MRFWGGCGRIGEVPEGASVWGVFKMSLEVLEWFCGSWGGCGWL